VTAWAIRCGASATDGGNFLAHERNVVLIGGTGTDKTHLAIATARAAIRNGARGRFFNVVDLVNKLEAETRAGCAVQHAAGLRRPECRRPAWREIQRGGRLPMRGARRRRSGVDPGWLGCIGVVRDKQPSSDEGDECTS